MDGRQLFVTGVHTGLGLGLARRSLARGAHVYAVSRQVPEELRGVPRFRFMPLDLRDTAAIAPTLRRLLDGVPAIELALLNAGVLGELKPLVESSLDELRWVMELNVWANKALLDALLDGSRRVDHVIAISSGAAVDGSAGWGGYAISKAALNRLVQVAANERPETHFSAVAPGIVETPMIEQVVASAETPSVARIRRTLAERRSFSPDAAADAIYDRLERIRAAGSGAFVDVRELEPD